MRQILTSIVKSKLRHRHNFIGGVANIWSGSVLTFSRKRLFIFQFLIHHNSKSPSEESDLYSEGSSYYSLYIYMLHFAQ